jgi:calcium/calmodulin-dependent protein kinase I
VHKATNQEYAVKCIKDSKLDAEDKTSLELEVQHLKEMDHANIMKFVDYIAEKDKKGNTTHYLVTELLKGGEVSDRIAEKDFYNEREARDLIELLLGSIKYIHAKGVVHRDLKTDNLLLTSKSSNSQIKIADFGYAKQLGLDSDGNPTVSLTTACGTPGYIAPEILEGRPYGTEVDIWSVGIITYILLCGYPPFNHENHTELFNLIKKGAYEFDSPFWDNASEAAKDLIRRMLVVDPKGRETADQLLQHEWITGEDMLGGGMLTSTSGTTMELDQKNPLTPSKDGGSPAGAVV